MTVGQGGPTYNRVAANRIQPVGAAAKWLGLSKFQRPVRVWVRRARRKNSGAIGFSALPLKNETL